MFFHRTLHGPAGGISLSAPLYCTRCGYQNQPGYQFCSNCGAPLAAASGVAAPAAPPTGHPYYAPYYDYEFTKQVDRTKTGILLLLIGTLINWIPVIGVIGSLLILIGAILVILGRKAFGATHSRNVVIAIVMFFVGILVTVALFVASALAAIPANFTGTMTQAQAQAFATAVVNNVLLSLIVGAVITGIASVLFTYALQSNIGKILLWAAYVANIGLAIGVYLVISPLIANAVAQAVVTGTYNSAPIDSLTAQASSYEIIGVVSALLFTGANYIAWSRISRGEIPARPGAPAVPPPGMPPSYPPPTPPSPPTPPQAPPSGPAPPITPP